MIRRVNPKDEPFLETVTKNYLVPFYGTKVLDKISNWIAGTNYKTAWIYEKSNQPIGLAVLSDKPDKYHAKLATLVVIPPLQRKGIGTALLKKVEKTVLSARKRELSATTSETNTAALNFLQKRGFIRIKKLPNKYKQGITEIVFIKNLCPLTHVVHIRQSDRKIFADIKAGRKTVKTRAATVKYQSYIRGDQIKFVCGKESVTKKISAISRFPTITSLSKKVPLSAVMPDAKTISEARKIYYRFPGYKEKIAKFGLVTFLKKSEIIF